MDTNDWHPDPGPLRLAGADGPAQWAYPAGYGGYGWGGWGGGATVQGSIARGLGAFAAGAGVYNQRTAVARRINADTILRWNEYLYQSQLERNRRYWERQQRDLQNNIAAHEEIQDRLRNNPNEVDIFRGDALNVALDEISNPAVYADAMKGANARIGGDTIEDVPFKYAPAGITLSIHQLATGKVPDPLKAAEFAENLKAMEKLDRKLVQKLENDEDPDRETIEEFLDLIYETRKKASEVLPENSLEAIQAERYLKTMHGLVVMLEPPPLDRYTADAKNHPDITLGEMLRFMTVFNLRFGVAKTPEQRAAYSAIYPKLLTLRKQIENSPALARASEPTGTEAEDFFSAMDREDIEKRSPRK